MQFNRHRGGHLGCILMSVQIIAIANEPPSAILLILLTRGVNCCCSKATSGVLRHHLPLKNKINITISVDWTIDRDRFRDHLVVFSTWFVTDERTRRLKRVMFELRVNWWTSKCQSSPPMFSAEPMVRTAFWIADFAWIAANYRDGNASKQSGSSKFRHSKKGHIRGFFWADQKGWSRSHSSNRVAAEDRRSFFAGIT